MPFQLLCCICLLPIALTESSTSQLYRGQVNKSSANSMFVGFLENLIKINEMRLDAINRLTKLQENKATNDLRTSPSNMYVDEDRGLPDVVILDVNKYYSDLGIKHCLSVIPCSPAVNVDMYWVSYGQHEDNRSLIKMLLNNKYKTHKRSEVSSTETSSESDVSSDITEFDDIMRSGIICAKTASKVCKKSCKKAYKSTCSMYKCSRRLRRRAKSECKRACREEFKRDNGYSDTSASTDSTDSSD